MAGMLLGMNGSLPPAVRGAVESQVGAAVQGVSRLSGGDISSVYRVDCSGGNSFVVKARHEAGEYPALYFAEAQGLHLLGQAGSLVVPQVLGYGVVGGWAYLTLSFLPPAPESPELQEALGRGLAELHRQSAAQFGGTPDNYMGSLPQRNPAASTAAEFFWSARLEPQLKAAERWLSQADLRGFEVLRERLPALIPLEVPALVHGDLWSGNALYSALGPALIDPAVSFSHREVDLSLMRLFGGFHERVFAAYQEAFPLAEGWQERVSLWNLYPLLAHVNMFGEGYVGRTRAALESALSISL